MASLNPAFITIVSGLPRSGTSMMMQMLTAGGMDVLSDRLREADADNSKGYFEYEPVKATKRDASWVQLAAGKAVKVIYAFLTDLPAEFDYRVLFMRRSLQEVIRSQQVMLERRGEQGALVGPEKLVKIFESQLKATDLWLGQQENVNVLNVEHERVLANPGSIASEVAKFLELPLDTTAMAGVVDEKLYHQRGATSQ